MLASFLSSIVDYAGMVWNYVIAVAFIVGGGYLLVVLGENPLNPLAKLFRYLGMVCICIGVLIATATYFKQVGAADCEAKQAALNLQARIDKLKTEADIQKANADLQEKRANQREAELDEATKKANDYEATLANRPVCALTADDLRRLRAIK